MEEKVVERVVGHTEKDGRPHQIIRWYKYASEEDTAEPREFQLDHFFSDNGGKSARILQPQTDGKATNTQSIASIICQEIKKSACEIKMLENEGAGHTG